MRTTRLFPICGFTLVALWAAPSPSAGQPAVPAFWHVPVDASQGAVLGRGSPVPYSAGFRVQVARGFGTGGAFRIGPAGAVLYRNPDWAVAGGLRASVRVVSLNLPMFTTWGVYLAGEQLFGTAEVTPAAASLIADLGLIRLGAWVVHDWTHETTAVEASLGVGLNSLIPLLRPARPPVPVFDFTGGRMQP